MQQKLPQRNVGRVHRDRRRLWRSRGSPLGQTPSPLPGGRWVVRAGNRVGGHIKSKGFNIHPFHYPNRLDLFRVAGRWRRSQLTLGEGGVHPGQVASPSHFLNLFYLLFIYSHSFSFSLSYTCVSNLRWLSIHSC